MDKPGGHRTGLNAHFGVDTSVLRNTSRNWPGIGGADAAPEPLALRVDNADRGRLLRYVQPNIMRHRNLRWCKPPGNMPGSRHYRLLGFAPRLPEVHTIKAATRSTANAPAVKSRACDPPVRMMTSRSCGGVARAGPRRATSDPSSCRSTRHSTSSPPRASSGSVLNLQSVTKRANSSLALIALFHCD